MNNPVVLDVKENREIATQLLQDLIRIPSYQTESDVVQYLAKRFEKLGIPYRTRKINEAGRENIVATWGEGERSLILNSHMDTVSPGDPAEWTHPPFSAEIADGKVYGRGAADAKGSLAAMISALESIVRSGNPLDGKLILTAVAYEEESGLGTEAEVTGGTLADAAIIGEPTELQVHVAHKGVVRLAVTTHGKAAHASEPWEGVNAISKMGGVTACLDRLAEEIFQRVDPLLGPATLAVTKVEGGIGRNIIPPSCRLVLDRRILPKETLESAQKEIEDALDRLQKEDPHLKVTVKLLSFAEAAATSPEDRIVQVALGSRSEVLQEVSEAGGFGACCDMRFLKNQGRVPSIILGPGSLSLAHKTDEFVQIDEYLKAVDLYQRIVLNWLQSAKTPRLHQFPT